MPADAPAPIIDPGYSPRQAVYRALNRWWMLALLVVAGGLIGLLINALRPAPYEAGFTILATLDQTTSGELIEYSEDILYESVGGIFYAPWMLERVAAQAAKEGYPIDLAYLKQNTTVERRLATWRGRVRHTDPQVADALARIWLEAGAAEMQRSYASAVQADGLQRYLESLESCLARAAANPPAEGQCASDGLASIQAELQQTGKALAEARMAAHGLSSSLQIGQAAMDLVPAQRVTPARAPMALAGALIGFLVGVWVVQLDFGKARNA